MCHSHYGDLAWARGDRSATRASFDRALTAFRELGDHSAVALTLIDLAELMVDQREYGAAYEMLSHALAVYRELGYAPGMTRVLDAFAQSAVRQRQPERATRLAASATAIRQSLGFALLPPSRRDSDRMGELEAARRALGIAGDAAEREGRRLNLENAIEYALSAQVE